jgi:hypothetical protein
MHWLPDKPKAVVLSSPLLVAKSGYISLLLAPQTGDFFVLLLC